MQINLSANITESRDFSTLTDAFIHNIQHKIDISPRKKINFNSPKNVFFSLIDNFALAS